MNVSGIGGFAGSASAMGLCRPPGPRPTDQEMLGKISDFLTSLDTDGNGSVSLAESGVSQASFSAIDTDGNGEITAEELWAYLKAHHPPHPSLAGLVGGDASNSQSAGAAAASGNGSVNPEEGGLTQADFSAMDTNKDGVVSLEELVAYLQAHRPPSSQPGTETNDAPDTGALIFTRQQAIQAYSGKRNELVTSLFQYLHNEAQKNGLDVTV